MNVYERIVIGDNVSAGLWLQNVQKTAGLTKLSRLQISTINFVVTKKYIYKLCKLVVLYTSKILVNLICFLIFGGFFVFLSFIIYKREFVSYYKAEKLWNSHVATVLTILFELLFLVKYSFRS
jgi:hypothetical protein